MPRLSNINIPEKKRVVIALTYIHGIGKSLAEKILRDAKISENLRVNKLNDAHLVAIQTELNKYSLEGDVRRKVAFNIKRLKEISCYRGIRHRLGLPVRGQITQKNARTRKGPRKTVANKKKSDGKT